MTARLGARLLGRASFAFEGREVVLRSRKAAAMLAYLCLRPAGATRDVLAETFWALGKLASVRQALYELRKLPGADEWLSDEGDLIRVFANTDVDAFVEAVSSGDSATALALYGGELLEGDLGLEHPPFQEWLASARARLFTLHLEALGHEAERLEAHGQWDEARHIVRKALDLDHLNEALWRSGMRLAYGAGSTVDALNLYRRCAARLAEELGVEPETETRELAEAIGRGEVIPIPSRPDLLPKERLHLLQVVFMGEGALGVRHIAAVLGLTDVEVADGLAELQRGDWLDEHLNVRGHHLATLRRSIAPSFKRLLHERIAEVLSTSSHVDEGVVARHLLAAFDPHAAAPRLVAAATTAIDNAAFDEATVFLFQAGWAAYELPALRLEAHVLLEGVASQRGDGALQEAALASAEALAADLQDDARLIDVKLRRSRQRLAQGHVGEGLELALEALEIANRIADDVLRARARNAVGAAHYFAGDLDGASAAFEANLQASDMIERYRAYSNLASLAGMRGSIEEAYGRFEEALTLARAIGPKADVAATLNNLAATADRMGEYAKAVRHFREGIAVSRRSQAVDREGRMLTNLAAVYARQGQLGPSWNTAEEVEELSDAISAPRLKLSAIELKADVQRLCGMLGHARASLASALEIAAQLEDERKVLTLTALLATIESLASGEFAGAEMAIAALDAERLTDNAPWLWLDLALAARDASQALAYLDKVGVESRLAHHRVVADIASVRAALLPGADAACLRAATEATYRLPGALDALEIVERPLGRLLLSLTPTRTPPTAVVAELAEQGAGLPRVMRDSLQLQPGQWLAHLKR